MNIYNVFGHIAKHVNNISKINVASETIKYNNKNVLLSYKNISNRYFMELEVSDFSLICKKPNPLKRTLGPDILLCFVVSLAFHYCSVFGVNFCQPENIHMLKFYI